MSRLWISGYRNYELGIFSENDLKLTVIKYALKTAFKAQIENGVDWFITGGQLGIEQWTIPIINELKEDYPEIQVAMMLPFAQFGNQWNEQNQMKLAALKQQVDFTATVSEQSYRSPQQLKNYQGFMLGHTDAAMLVYDIEHEGKPTYDYSAIQAFQAHHPYDVTLIDFDWLQESATEYQENQHPTF
ncbi:SLOG family protein [Furfurilactobacillus curtus]|uniref:UPF0398 protein JCM31185_03040 n=1 Tax=Furfurilactobacillus curtus TaxID=1746200 RepID=A0ABQ5JLK3_9LACO